MTWEAVGRKLMELPGKIPICFGVFSLFFPFLIPFFRRALSTCGHVSFQQKVGHNFSQLSLSAKGELVAGCGGQQAGGDFPARVFNLHFFF